MVKARVAHWPNGPQLRELRAILDKRKNIVKTKIFPVPKPFKFSNSKIQMIPVPVKPIPNSVIKKRAKNQDELTREHAHLSKPVGTSSSFIGRQNSANKYRSSLPVDVQREAERLRVISSTKVTVQKRVKPIPDGKSL